MVVQVKYIAELREEHCDGCRLCLPVCSYHALLSVPGEPEPMIDTWACTGCGTCVTTCPREALVLIPKGNA